jgi:hypothetical protein
MILLQQQTSWRWQSHKTQIKIWWGI